MIDASRARMVVDACSSEDHRSRNAALAPLLGLRAGEHVLEVGCGGGAFTRELARSGARVTAVDADASAIDAARSALADAGTVELAVMDGRRLAFDDGAFDAVACSRVLGHARSPRMILREMVRVLRPGGRVLVVEPAMTSEDGTEPELRSRVLGVLQRDIGHDVPAIVREAGCEVLVSSHLEITREPPAALFSLVAWAERLGRCTPADVARYREQLETALAAGTYRREVVHAAVVGRRVTENTSR